MIVPDYLEPLVGWRAWGNISNEGYLKALAGSYYWVPGKPMQCRCQSCGGFTKPTFELGVHNGAGFYAFKSITQLIEDRAYGQCIGQVYLWGQIVEHTRGYRAEFAYPKALLIDNPWHKDTLEKAWKIPVEVGDIKSLYQDARRKAAELLAKQQPQIDADDIDWGKR